MKKLLFSLLLFPSLLLGQFSGPSDSDTSDRDGGASLVWLGTPSNSSESVSNIRVGDTIVLGIKVTSYNASKTSIDYAHIDVQIDKRLYTYVGQTFNTDASGNSNFVGGDSKMQFNNNFDHYDIWDQWQNATYVSDTNYEIHHLESADTSTPDANQLETLDWYVKFQLKVNAYDEDYDYTDGVLITMGRVEVQQDGVGVLLDPLYAYPYQDFSNEPIQAAPTFTSTVANDGPNAIIYKSFKINDYANNNNQAEYNAHPASSSDFDAMFDYANKNTTTWTHQGRDTATKAFTWPWSNILPRHDNSNFGWIIEGYFVPPTSGTYKFQLNSDDRSDFWFDANDDGTITNTGIGLGNGSREVDITNLTAGVSYKFRVRYEQGAGGANLYLKWKSPEDVAAGAAFAFNGNTIYSIDADDYTVAIDYTVNYNFHSNITPSDFGVNTYYQSGTNEVTQNSNSTTVSLDSDGKANISDQIDEELTAGSNYKATPTDGGVEYMIVYDWDSNNQRHRVLIDKRMFNSFGYTGFADNAPTSLFQNVTALDLYDVFDGSLTYYQDDLYWAQYYIYTNITSNISNTSYSSKFRDTGSSNAVQIGSINFSAISNYKTQYVVFNEPSSTVLASTAAAVVTVADVYLAFQELTDRGINNDQSGNKFTYGIQYANANVDRDGDFDFDDTYMMLDWLNGGTSFSITGLASVMRLIETSEYNSVASSAVGNYSTQTMFPLGLSTGTDTYTKNVNVTWLGDVNLSHSPTPTNNLSVTGMTIGNAPTMVDTRMFITNAKTIELRIESEVKDDKIHYRVRGTYGGTPIGAIQLQLKYNKDKVQLSDNIFQTGGTNFINDQNGIISFGSLKIDEGTLNNLSTYEFIFTGETSEGSLGLFLIEDIEAVTTDNEPVNILFQ